MLSCRRRRAVLLCTLMSGIGALPTTIWAQSSPSGREIFLNPAKGNCAACHALAGDTPALRKKVGPDLVNMSSRYPDKAHLRDDISDIGARLGESIMPLYGRHRILSDAQIDALVNYVYSL